MKRLLLMGCLSLVLALSAMAQNSSQTASHDVSKETCNAEFPNGFKGMAGEGANGALRLKFYVTANYKMTNFEGIKKEIVGLYVQGMNNTAAERGYTTRFEGLDFDSDAPFNFLVFVNFYHNDSTDEYTIVYDVHGWGKHHLFTYSAISKGGGSDAVQGAIDNLPKYFENGWTCAR